jgi:hypothetical protein
MTGRVSHGEETNGGPFLVSRLLVSRFVSFLHHFIISLTKGWLTKA